MELDKHPNYDANSQLITSFSKIIVSRFVINIHVISPKLALRHYRLHRVFHSFRRVTVFLQQFLYHHTHFSPGRITFLPVNRPILTQGICKLFGNGNQFFVFIEILDCLGFRQRVIESKLIGGMASFSKKRCTYFFYMEDRT